MLKAFEYIENHPIQSLHTLYEQIITTICESASGIEFKDVVFPVAAKTLLDSEKAQKHDFLYKDIEKLHNVINDDDAIKQKIKNAFANNNKLRELCNKEDIETFYYGDFGDAAGPILNTLAVNLYTYIFGRAAITTTYRISLEKYFYALTAGKINQCPFCGLTHFTSKYEDGRDAFDHYLPKGKYPFNSVNNKNLFPMCHHCNTLNKKAKEVIYHDDTRSDANRRKAFYPFDSSISIDKLQIKIEILNKNLSLLSIDPEKDLLLTMTYTDHEEEKDQWDRVFGITKRYKGRIKEDVSDWLKLLLSDYELNKDVLSAKEIIVRFIRKLKREPLIDQQFLKASFFQALNDEGILEKTLVR